MEAGSLYQCVFCLLRSGDAGQVVPGDHQGAPPIYLTYIMMAVLGNSL